MAARGRVIEKDHGLRALFALSEQAKTAHVKVGFLDDGPGGEEHDPESGLTNAQIAAVHEFGSSDGKIPQRSFLRSTLNENRPRYVEEFKLMVRACMEGKLTLEKALGVMGARIANDVKKKVTSGPPLPPPNAPSVALRKSRGRITSDPRVARLRDRRSGRFVPTGKVRTLIDTGRLITSITWAVIVPPFKLTRSK